MNKFSMFVVGLCFAIILLGITRWIEPFWVFFGIVGLLLNFYYGINKNK